MMIKIKSMDLAASIEAMLDREGYAEDYEILPSEEEE